MSSLTEQERRGLEEVFLSISPSRNGFVTEGSRKQSITFFIKSRWNAILLFFRKRLYFRVETPSNEYKITKQLKKIQKRRKI